MATAAEKKQAELDAAEAEKAAAAKRGEDTQVQDAPKNDQESTTPDTTDENGQSVRNAEGKPPVVGVEPGGGILEEGTGDFAEDHQELPEEGTIFDEGRQIVKETAVGDRVAVYVGVDGENAVSPQNPLRKTTVR